MKKLVQIDCPIRCPDYKEWTFDIGHEATCFNKELKRGRCDWHQGMKADAFPKDCPLPTVSGKKWLRFEKVTKTKTSQDLAHVNILSRETDDDLGTIAYDKGWRQYVWYPQDQIQMSAGCLIELANYMAELNKTKGCYKVKGK